MGMNETERYDYFANVVDYARDQRSTAAIEDNCYHAMRILWGTWQDNPDGEDGRFVLSDDMETLAQTIKPYAANCLRFCTTAIDFATLINGLRNAYFAGQQNAK